MMLRVDDYWLGQDNRPLIEQLTFRGSPFFLSFFSCSALVTAPVPGSTVTYIQLARMTSRCKKTTHPSPLSPQH